MPGAAVKCKDVAHLALLSSVSKDKALHTIDTAVGKIVDTRLNAHEYAAGIFFPGVNLAECPSLPRSPINRVTRAMSQMLATGDDDGVIKVPSSLSIHSNPLIHFLVYLICSHSSGIYEKRQKYGRTNSILTSYRTFYGLTTRRYS